MPVAAQESFADLAFPQKGIDLSEGFNSQLPGSTPVAINVRLFEAMTERARGGSRAGLAKYIAAQLPAGAHLIQHLNVIVDPQNEAMLDEDDGTFPDPSDAGPSYAWGVTQSSRNPGRFVRQGGSGRMAVKNSKKKKFRYIQGVTNAPGAGFPAHSATLPLAVTAGNLLILAANLSGDDPATIPVPSDTIGSTYQKAVTFLDSGNNFSAVIWFAVAPLSGANTVTMDSTSQAYQPGILLEYNGNSSTPNDQSASHEDTPIFTGSPIAFSCGPVGVSSTKELVVIFTFDDKNPASGRTITGDGAFTIRFNSGTTPAAGVPQYLLQDKLSVDSPITMNGLDHLIAADIDPVNPIFVISLAASFFHG